MLEVTCALICKDDFVLCTQRSESMSHPLQWEFPGGKIESGESITDCLHREIQEELNIRIQIIRPLTPVTFDYAYQIIHLIPFLTSYQSGILTLSEHKAYKWLRKEELISLDWVSADLPIVKEYFDTVLI